MDLIRSLKDVNLFLKTFKIPRKSLSILGILMSVTAGLQALSAGLVIPFLNSLQNADTSATGQNKIVDFLNSLFSGMAPENRFVSVLFSLLAVIAVIQIMLIVMERYILKFSMFDIQYHVARVLYSKIINSRLKFFYNQNSGGLINHLTVNVNKCFNCINYLFMIVCPVLFAGAYLVMGFLIMPYYTLGFLVVMGLLAFLFTRMLPFIYELGQKNQRVQENANTMIIESLQGIRNVILSCMEKQHEKKFDDINITYYMTIFESSWITRSLPIFFKFLSVFLVFVVVFINRERLIGADDAYISQMFFFSFIAGNICMNLAKVHTYHSSFAFCFEGLRAILRLNAELDQHLNITKDKLVVLPGFNNQLVVNQMGFQYNQTSHQLSDINFSLQKGKKIAFVGRSGSGKSTLIDVISGFHDDYSGSIKIDGLELRDISKKDWRQLLGYVSQETFIFNDTVRNNITFGFDRPVSEDEIEVALKKAQIYETFMALEQKLDTQLGERGVKLSGGEKQRLAIARLFLKNPHIVLLDEATSALDSESEKKVKDAINLLSQGRTVIAVAHRLSTIADYDYIYVMEGGRIVESGTHFELINRQGYYFKFYNTQTLERSYV
ncbi:MAG: ABC transporter ATP-binding protein [Candidatus Omnitrophica bacterium]|nr:ABC transporter ATP-binding protein [Candidatus Omnitrophota bacterium]